VKISVEEMQERVRAQVGMPSRLGYTALLVAGAGMAGLSASLLATETALPPRTRLAFALVVVVGLAWASFAGWVLARRRVLFGRQEVVAASMAVAITVVFLAGAAAVRDRIGYGGVATAAVMCGAALVMLVRARGRVARLSERLRALESGRD
jgi:hypothetical protein